MVTKFSVERSILVEWLTAISKAFTFSGQLHDIFKCIVICLEEGGNGLQIKVADGISYVHIKNIPHEKHEFHDTFSFAIYADTFQKILAASNKERIVFEWDYDKGNIVIKTEGRYKIPSIDSELFPVVDVPSCEMKPFGDLDFVDVLDKLTPFAAKELARPELAGVSIADKVYVSTVGTHGVVHPRIESVFDKTTVSPYAIKFLNALNRSKLGDVLFGNTGYVFVIKTESFLYTCRLAVTEFPWGDLDNVMNLRNDFAFKVLFDPVLFYGALRRVLLLDTDKFTQLGLQFGEKSLRLFCNSQMSASSSVEEVPVAEIQLPEGGEFQPLDVRLGVVVVEAFRRLFEEKEGMPVMLTVINDRSPIFIQQRGSEYVFYTQVLRPV